MPNSTPRSDPDPERFRNLMMSDEPEFEEVLRCVFGITSPVVDVYRHLLSKPGSTAKELAREDACDSSNVNRKLVTLCEKGLVSRRRELLEDGGHVYRYEPTPLDRTQELMHRTLEEWTAFMHEQIDAVDEILESSPSR